MSIRIQEQILFDLAMAFGNSLDLKDVLTEGLPIYLRRLGCMAGAVLMTSTDDGFLGCKIVSSYPVLGKTPEAITSLIDMVKSNSDCKATDEFCSKLPMHKIIAGRNAYLMELPGFGFLVLLKSGHPLGKSLITSLLPINTKIANACISCVSYQRYAELNSELHKEVAERKIAVRELMDSERRHRVIFEYSPLGMIHFDSDGLIKDCNEPFARLMGSTRQDLLGFDSVQNTSPKMSAAIKIAISGTPSLYEDYYTSVVGGNVVYLRAVFNPVTPGKAKSEVIATIEDFAKRKEAEESLRQSESRLSKILSSIQAGVLLIDPATRTIVDSNTEACRLIGLEKEQIVGRVCHDFICAAEKGKCPVLDLKQDVDKSERILLTASGAKLTVQKTVSTIIIDGKEQLLECFVDITQRKEAEEQLIKAKDAIENYAKILEDTNDQLTKTTASRDDLEQEVADRKRAESRLRESRQLYQELVENAASIILRIDKNGRITFFNEYAERLFGFSRDEIIGRKTVGTIIPEVDSSGRFLNGFVDKMFHNPEGFVNHENENMLKDGSRIWVAWSNKALYNSDNEFTEMLCVGSDITERRNSERALRFAKLQAEAANRAKSEFLANMSHEIRTPMNAILGVADLLADSELNEEQRHYIRLFESAGESLMNLINEILDLSKIETGHMELESVPFSIPVLLGDISAIMEISADSKGLDYSSIISPDVPSLVMGDQVRMKQILLNLVGNAVKFTEHGSVSVSVIAHKINDSSVSIKFSVSDTGIGVSKNQLSTIFESFAQADSSTTRKYGGTGLGLAIAKKFADLMKGEILVESEEGVGTTFHFSAPFDVCTENCITNKLNSENDKNNYSHIEKKKILVVEDSESNRMLIAFYIGESQHEMVLTENGLEGLEAFKEGDFDVVFMDIQMPVMDGLAATKAIREYEKEHSLEPIPIVALTANAFNEDRKLCFEAGCTRFLAKPIKKSELFMEISML
ncbi:PAS domain-containing hybrid sensor histidine kinase/response regulator [Maridesulfovibrio frigidus]|uniref:PAS domain-containing hybrid sensor histidine kinase/response regulator n=1 Tax=Maridesulfovibrio frigidus TaxID=340956 RepID=UPI00068D9205|nr:PAS domain-containing hybrid sensor histidine kinase/response regulator [Maridesulfovibrio frigidus]